MKKSVFFYVKNNKKYLAILLIMFFIGIIGGIIQVNNSNEIQSQQINQYVNSLKDNIKSSNEINRNVILLKSIKENILFIFIIWFLGSTILGNFLIYFAVLYKGFSLGYTISAIIASLGSQSGILFVVLSLLLQNLVYLPVIFVTSISGIKLYQNLKLDKTVNIKKEFIKYIIVLLVAIIFSIIASFIEVYISTNFLIIFKDFL